MALSNTDRVDCCRLLRRGVLGQYLAVPQWRGCLWIRQRCSPRYSLGVSASLGGLGAVVHGGVAELSDVIKKRLKYLMSSSAFASGRQELYAREWIKPD